MHERFLKQWIWKRMKGEIPFSSSLLVTGYQQKFQLRFPKRKCAEGWAVHPQVTGRMICSMHKWKAVNTERKTLNSSFFVSWLTKKLERPQRSTDWQKKVLGIIWKTLGDKEENISSLRGWVVAGTELIFLLIVGTVLCLKFRVRVISDFIFW